jgi:hypothetical protein
MTEPITITNVPSFADKLAVPLEVAGFGTLMVDTAYGGGEEARPSPSHRPATPHPVRGWR